MNSEKPIFVGYDGSAPSRLALRWALEEAEAPAGACDNRACSHAGHPATGLALDYNPGDDPEARRGSRRCSATAVALASEWAPDVTVTPRLVAAAPAVALLDAMGDASLIVLGTRGLDGFAELLVGSDVSARCHARHRPRGGAPDRPERHRA